MTDKQIIIDGVDVSRCEFLIISKDKQMCRCIKSDLFGGIEFVENAKNGSCQNNPNCYYKQLKRKEQECEELKQTLAEIKPILELYANSKVGEEQIDGTYKLSGGIWDSFGFYTATYDPRPARQALQKISEVEDDRN